jgi:hypothetical protein
VEGQRFTQPGFDGWLMGRRKITRGENSMNWNSMEQEAIKIPNSD